LHMPSIRASSRCIETSIPSKSLGILSIIVVFKMSTAIVIKKSVKTSDAN
jgi:hypothetical protein